jgi:predicted small lipoprotein YifL
VILIVKSSFALPAALATLLTLSACGQTGPLYMPKPPKHKGAVPAGPAAPAPAPATIAVPPAPAAGTAVPAAESNANNTQATMPPSSVPASQ